MDLDDRALADALSLRVVHLLTLEGGKWTARAEAATGAIGSTGRCMTTITVVGGKNAGGDEAIERTCLDVISRLAEVGLESSSIAGDPAPCGQPVRVDRVDRLDYARPAPRVQRCGR